MHKKFYNPLPDGLTIKKSSIHGLGLFTTKDFKKNHRFGTIHIIHFDKVIRTPMGGFINHSDEPNCKKVKNIKSVENLLGKWSDLTYEIISIKPIKKDTEITLKYTLYTPKNPQKTS